MAHPDLDDLMNACLDFAKQSLIKNKEFFPFGASKKVNGEISLNMGYNGEEHPSSQDLIDLMLSGYIQEAKDNEIIGACICSDVRLRDEDPAQNAIRFELDHLNDQPVMVLLPYELNSKDLILGDMIAQKGVVKIF